MTTTLYEWDARTGDYTIYSRYGGVILLTGNAPCNEGERLNGAFRAAEQLAVKHTQQTIAHELEEFIERWSA